MTDRNWESDIAMLLLAVFVAAAVVLLSVDNDLLIRATRVIV